MPKPSSKPRNLPTVYSYSRLGTYTDCSERYRQYYVEKNRLKERADALEIGSLVHGAIETYYRDGLDSSAQGYDRVIAEYLSGLGLVSLEGELLSIARIMLDLYTRSGADYTGKDAIRTGDGSVAKNPAMTKAWKAALTEHDLPGRMAELDRRAVMLLGPDWKPVSLCNVYTQSRFLAYNYKHPKSIASPYAVEFQFSELITDDPAQPEPYFNNLVTLPSGRIFTGYIDLVGKDHKDQIVIIDHKTSMGDAPTLLAVAHHEQLLLYAYFWHQLTGTWPVRIGINHIRSSQLVEIDVNPARALAVAHRYDQLVEAIEKGVFIKAAPFGYQSPCGITSASTGMDSACPYLPTCHPDIARALGWQPDEPADEGLELPAAGIPTPVSAPQPDDQLDDLRSLLK